MTWDLVAKAQRFNQKKRFLMFDKRKQERRLLHSFSYSGKIGMSWIIRGGKSDEDLQNYLELLQEFFDKCQFLI